MASEANYPFKQANKYHPGRIDDEEVIVVHCTAGPESATGTGAEAVQNMFAHNTRDASAHVTVDQNSSCRSVHDWDTAWAAKYFNANGLHVEIVGMPNQTRAQWLDPISKASLLRAAAVVADWCKRHGIPARYLTIDELRKGNVKGISFHADCEKAKPSSGHTDPGPNFPRDVFLQMVKDALARLSPPPAKRSNPYLSKAAPCRYGDKGDQVRFVQWACGIPVDGSFGKQTHDIVCAIQKRLGWTVNGHVDQKFIDRVKGIKR